MQILILFLRYDLGCMSWTWSARPMFAPVHLVIQPERELQLPSQQSDLLFLLEEAG